MSEFLAGVLVLGEFGLLLLGLSWLAVRIRRRKLGVGLMGPFDAIWRPMESDMRVEIRQQEERGVDQGDDEPLGSRPARPAQLERSAGGYPD